MTALLVGSGGLLGRQVRRRLGDDVLTVAVPWGTPEASAALRSGLDRLASRGAPWSVLWCAGAGVVATAREDLDTEVRVYAEFLESLARIPGPGRLFLASSAGGVYAGSPDPAPYTEHSRTGALAPYGEAKLEMERLTAGFVERTGARALVGRLANLYGPGQDLSKPQGLVSQLCLAQLSGQPLGVYVALDTLRDYLYVEDAAALVVEGMERLAREGPAYVVKILASGRPASVAAVVGELTRTTRRRPPVVFASSPLMARQVRDLRLRSVVWPEIDAVARTPLPVGLARTRASLRRERSRASATTSAS